MATTPRIFRTMMFFSATVAAASLSACASFSILAPTADAVVMLPSAAHVVMPGARISNVTLVVDGNDVSSQIAYDASSGKYVADLMLAEGMHTIVASADAYCAYCNQQVYRASDTKTFCVAATSPFTAKTIFAQGDDKGWSSTDARTVALATNDGSTMTAWTLRPKGAGLISVPGTIRSRLFPCSCLRSPNNTIGAAVELAPCDITDSRQVWDGTRQQLVGGVALYEFANAESALCLAEGNAPDSTAGKLVQSSCSGTADRLWKVRRNDNMQFEGSLTPWNP